jgi:hypothetical protein
MPDIQAAQSAVPLPSAELNLGGTSTSEKQFLSASASGGVAAGSPCQCRIPGSNVLKNRQFSIRIQGRVTGGTTTNFTVKVYYGNSTTIGSNTSLATTGAIAVNSASGQFFMELICSWDATSQKIGGVFYGWVNATAVAQVVLSNLPTAVDLSTEAVLTTASGTQPVLTVTGQFSAGNAANVAFVDQFEVLPM